ncbi:uncharacterized protein C12orf45 homolog [Gigantopelta aegis]|uniref:uncharacterized protein C12orf45 homolog n=1 Tax=Gigantopelta aegis TaxID=1735272 RepID=UPI001B888DFA|nr:uncharacterized protein C12orf45 homolog [Gigantopelta aegis]
MSAPIEDQRDPKDKFQDKVMAQTESLETPANQKSSKQLLYSEKYSEDLLSDRLNVLTAKGRQPHFGISPQTFRVPRSSVLGQVKNFLPQMEAANQSLNELVKTVPRDQLDIENVDGCSGPIIEMNLALIETNDSCSDEDFSDSSSDSDSDDSDDLLCEKIYSHVTEDSIKLNTNLPKRKPHIVELGKSNSESSNTSDIIER